MKYKFKNVFSFNGFEENQKIIAKLFLKYQLHISALSCRLVQYLNINLRFNFVFPGYEDIAGIFGTLHLLLSEYPVKNVLSESRGKCLIE